MIMDILAWQSHYSTHLLYFALTHPVYTLLRIHRHQNESTYIEMTPLKLQNYAESRGHFETIFSQMPTPHFAPPETAFLASPALATQLGERESPGCSCGEELGVAGYSWLLLGRVAGSSRLLLATPGESS